MVLSYIHLAVLKYIQMEIGFALPLHKRRTNDRKHKYEVLSLIELSLHYMQLFILSWDFFQLQTFYFIAFSSIFSILCIGLDYPRFCPSFVLGFYFFFMLQVKKCEIFVLSKNSNLSIKLFTLPLNHVGMCSIS